MMGDGASCESHLAPGTLPGQPGSFSYSVVRQLWRMPALGAYRCNYLILQSIIYMIIQGHAAFKEVI
jgi:hypothetical protein